MISLALVGKNISHSKSPDIYRELLGQEIEYQIYDCAEEKDIPTLPKIFEKHQGLSITSPYKKFFLNKVSVMPGFTELNAINAIRKTNNEFEAINTDYLAMDKLLNDFNMNKVILLGDGVMSFITQKLLQEKNIEHKVFSRKKNGPLENLNLSEVFFSENGKILIINTCSRSFVFRGKTPLKSVFWDLNYDFPPHRDYFPTQSVKYLDGINLLRLQAKFALEFFRF